MVANIAEGKFFSDFKVDKDHFWVFCLHFVSKVLQLGKVADKDGTWQLLGQFLPWTNDSSAKKREKRDF